MTCHFDPAISNPHETFYPTAWVLLGSAIRILLFSNRSLWILVTPSLNCRGYHSSYSDTDSGKITVFTQIQDKLLLFSSFNIEKKKPHLVSSTAGTGNCSSFSFGSGSSSNLEEISGYEHGGSMWEVSQDGVAGWG